MKMTQTVFCSGDDRLSISRVGDRAQIDVNGKAITLDLDDLSDLFEEIRDLKNEIRDGTNPF